MKKLLSIAAKICSLLWVITSGCATAVRYHDRDRSIDFTTKPADRAAELLE